MKLNKLLEGAAYRLSDMLRTYPELESLFSTTPDAFNNKDYVSKKTGDILKEHVLLIMIYMSLKKFDDRYNEANTDYLAVKKDFIDLIHDKLENFSAVVKTYIGNEQEFFNKYIREFQLAKLYGEINDLVKSDKISDSTTLKNTYSLATNKINDLGKLAFAPTKVTFIDTDTKEKYEIKKGISELSHNQGDYYGGTINISLTRTEPGKKIAQATSADLGILIEKGYVVVNITTREEFKKHKAIFKILGK